jgi:hypothetical protein
MNELQLSLLGLGVVAILLVVVYNRWLERQYRKTHSPDPVPVDETPPVSSDGVRQEPSWDAEDPSVDDTNAEPREQAKPSAIEPAFEAVNMADALPALSDAEAWVDAIATLRFYEPQTAASIRNTVEQMGIARFDRIECYTGDAWHLPDRLPVGALVSNIRCRLQLASRRGPLSPDVLHEWMRAVESLAQSLSAGLSVESENKILERASHLDAFCARVDALISLNLRSRAGEVRDFSGRLAGQGLSGTYPAMARLNVDGDVDFQVVADEASGVLSLTLDFPHVNRPDLAVNDMLELARTLAIGLDADIVDDGGRPLDEHGIALLANQVVRLSAALQAQGIEPGSPLARRLFA